MSLYLISGAERVLADRAAAEIVADLKVGAPDLETVRISPEIYQPGDLGVAASPSLFGGERVLIVHDADEAAEPLLDEIVTYVASPEPGVALIVRHKGGNRGKRALDALKKAGARVTDVPVLKSESDKSGFAMNEFRTARRKADPAAVAVLVAAVGKDVAELASACAQLVADTTGVITVPVVEQYYGGRVETTGYKVAQAAMAGNAGEALRLLRHALAGGMAPVPIVAALAAQLRQVGRVAAAGRTPAGVLAKELKMAPWQVDAARRQAAGWDGYRLGRAIQAVAAADVEVKGGGRDPEFAVERAVVAICRERTGGLGASTSS